MSAFRAVLDTNIVMAAHRRPGANSPNREVIRRWTIGEFTLLYSESILHEYVEKLIAMGMPDVELEAFLRLLRLLGEKILIRFYHLRRYPRDLDDVAFELCALNGNASHLVSYDGGFSDVAADCSFKICQPLAALL